MEEQIKATFRELHLDLKCCCDVAIDILSKYYEDKFESITSSVFYAATFHGVEEDEKIMQLLKENLYTCELAKQLLKKIEGFDYSQGRELDALEPLINIKSLQIIKHITGGSCGEVYKPKWLKLLSATKIMKIPYDNFFIKDISSLDGLTHPNLIKYFCALKDIANIYQICRKKDIKMIQ